MSCEYLLLQQLEHEGHLLTEVGKVTVESYFPSQCPHLAAALDHFELHRCTQLGN